MLGRWCRNLPVGVAWLPMPELPEVETTRRGLEPYLQGSRIVEAESRRARMLRRQPRGRDFADRLRGRRVLELRRLGKFIFIDVEGDLTWVIHLGMSGRMQVADPGEPESPHTNVVVRTPAKEIRFVDPRTFGFTAVLTPEEFDESPLTRLGPDALTDLPRSRALAARLAGRKPAIKSLLLDQRLLAGLGNIYADEVLCRARVAPHREGGSLDAGEVTAIRAAIRPVLEAGLKHGGTSLSDLAYLIPDGRAGQYVHRLKVYGREDEPCRRCGTPIRRSVIGQRSSYWCPTCQT
jgi:formamidopyrimidine-DNA glycosylase